MSAPLEAGPELDELVAERVMGWETAGRDTAVWRRPDGRREWKHRWCPSRDMNDAWAVVERLAESGWWLKLVSPWRPGDPYFAGFSPHGVTGWNGKADHEASGETAALAICRAALQACEVGLTP